MAKEGQEPLTTAEQLALKEVRSRSEVGEHALPVDKIGIFSPKTLNHILGDLSMWENSEGSNFITSDTHVTIDKVQRAGSEYIQKLLDAGNPLGQHLGYWAEYTFYDPSSHMPATEMDYALAGMGLVQRFFEVGYGDEVAENLLTVTMEEAQPILDRASGHEFSGEFAESYVAGQVLDREVPRLPKNQPLMSDLLIHLQSLVRSPRGLLVGAATAYSIIESNWNRLKPTQPIEPAEVFPDLDKL